MDEFLANEAKGTKVIGAHSLQEMVSTLKKPRRIILLVKAGSAVDDFINKLVRQTFTLLAVFWRSFLWNSQSFTISEVSKVWKN